jgi:hypothetical protein
VTTGHRPLAAGRFLARHFAPGVEVTAIRAGSGNCYVTPEIGGVCDFTDLPGDASLSVTVTWRAREAAPEQDVSVTVSTAGDVAPGNNGLVGRAEVLGPTDLELRVGAATGATPGVIFSFPAISVVNGSERAVGAKLEVTLPAGVVLVDVSAANAICSGDSVLRCDFGDLDAHSTSTVNLNLRASARGSYVSALKLTSVNDTNPANDTSEVTLSISGGGAVAESQESGGGGGSLEWLSLALLLLLARNRLAPVRSSLFRWNPSNRPD